MVPSSTKTDRQTPPRTGRRAIRKLALLALLLLWLVGCDDHDHGHDTGRVEVTLGVAASLRHAMPELVEEFRKHHPRPDFQLVYGSSGGLRNRVHLGAPIDAVVFASSSQVDALIESGDVVPDSRTVVASNGLVLIGPTGARKYTFETLYELPAGDKLAIGDPGAVPAGRYARDGLMSLGVWRDLSADRVVYAGDVGAVFAYVQRGEVAAAIVYPTELDGIDDVQVFEHAKGDWVPKPEVVAGVVKHAKQAGPAGKFIKFLAARRGQAILAKHGFGPPR